MVGTMIAVCSAGSYRGTDGCNAGQVAYLLYSVGKHDRVSARTVVGGRASDLYY